MADEKSVVQEFKLDPDCELRFEVESKNEKVTLEVIGYDSSWRIISFITNFVLYYCYYFIILDNTTFCYFS